MPRAVAPISLVVPELALSGYPPKDLLERPAFLAAARASLEALARATARVSGRERRRGREHRVARRFSRST